MSVLWFFGLLVVAVNCQLNLQQFYGSSTAIFWGQVTANGKMKVVVPIKGCLAKDASIVLTGNKQKNFKVGRWERIPCWR